MREFTTKPKEPAKPVDFSIDGREMVFRNPGWAPIVLMNQQDTGGITRAYLDWFSAGLADEDAKWVLGRLLDAGDEFDLPDITKVVLGVVEEVTGRPTAPPTDSSPSPETAGLTDGRHLVTSTPNSSTPGD